MGGVPLKLPAREPLKAREIDSDVEHVSDERPPHVRWREGGDLRFLREPFDEFGYGAVRSMYRNLAAALVS